MTDGVVRRLPVVVDGKVAGIFGKEDVLKTLLTKSQPKNEI